MYDQLIPILQALLDALPKSKQPAVAQMIDGLRSTRPVVTPARGRPSLTLRVVLDDGSAFFVHGNEATARWAGISTVTFTQYMAKQGYVERPVWFEGIRRIARIDRPSMDDYAKDVGNGVRTIALAESDMPVEGSMRRVSVANVQVGQPRKAPPKFRREGFE